MRSDVQTRGGGIENVPVPGGGADGDFDPTLWLADYGDYLYRFALVRVKQRELAEDLVQDTLVSAYGARESYRGQASVKTWLVAILRNKIIDYVRKAARRSSVSYEALGGDEVVDESFNSLGIWADWVSDWGESPEALVERKLFVDQLQKCIEALPENFREVFILRVVDGLETDEICSQLEISPNNLWVILYRARMRLKKCIGKKWFSEKS